MAEQKPKDILLAHLLLLLCGVFCCSTAAILIKASQVPPAALAAWRLLLAVGLLLPLFVRDLMRSRTPWTRAMARAAVLPGLMLGLHFITWIIGIRLATVANGSLIVNLVPLAMPLFLWLVLRERLRRREWLGTAVAALAVALLLVCDFDLDPALLAGDLVCLGSMLFFCLYLVLSRKYRHIDGIWQYVVPVYAVAGLCCLLGAVGWDTLRHGELRLMPANARAWGLVLGLAVVPTLMGHSILNFSMKKLRGQIVSIVNVCQFIFAGGMAYVVWRQTPHWSLYAAAVLVLGACAVVTAPERAPASQPPAGAGDDTAALDGEKAL